MEAWAMFGRVIAIWLAALAVGGAVVWWARTLERISDLEREMKWRDGEVRRLKADLDELECNVLDNKLALNRIEGGE